MTQSFIATKLGLQPSYLSRVLNDEKAQFSEDQLYRILEVLQFNAWERDYLILLRTYETTALSGRRSEIEERIRILQNGDQVSDLTRLKSELERVFHDIHQIAKGCGLHP